MPTVNALTKQFEASSQKEKNVPLRPRKLSNSSPTQQYAKSKSRVVIIDKSESELNPQKIFTLLMFQDLWMIYPEERQLCTHRVVW